MKLQNVRLPAQNAAKLVRAMMVTFGAGSCMFNDKMKDGRRSIKVWGWNQEEWRLAVDILRAHGFSVAVRNGGIPGRIHRIWVG